MIGARIPPAKHGTAGFEQPPHKDPHEAHEPDEEHRTDTAPKERAPREISFGNKTESEGPEVSSLGVDEKLEDTGEGYGSQIGHALSNVVETIKGYGKSGVGMATGAAYDSAGWAKNKTSEGAHWVVEEAEEIGRAAYDVTAHGLHAAADKTQEGAHWVVEEAEEIGRAAYDAGARGINAVADKAQEGANWAMEGPEGFGRGAYIPPFQELDIAEAKKKDAEEAERTQGYYEAAKKIETAANEMKEIADSVDKAACNKTAQKLYSAAAKTKEGVEEIGGATDDATAQELHTVEKKEGTHREMEGVEDVDKVACHTTTQKLYSAAVKEGPEEIDTAARDATVEGLQTITLEKKESEEKAAQEQRKAAYKAKEHDHWAEDADQEVLRAKRDAEFPDLPTVPGEPKQAAQEIGSALYETAAEGLQSVAGKKKEGVQWGGEEDQDILRATDDAEFPELPTVPGEPKQAAREIGSALYDTAADGLELAANKTKEGAQWAMEGAEEAIKAACEATARGLHIAADKTQKGAKDAGSAVYDTTAQGLRTAADKTKEGAQWAAEGAEDVVKATVGATAQGLHTVADKTQKGAKDAGSAVYDTTAQGLRTAADKTKEGAQWAAEGAEGVVKATVGATSQGLHTVADKTSEGAHVVVKGATDTASGSAEWMKEKTIESARWALDSAGRAVEAGKKTLDEYEDPATSEKEKSKKEE